ncbi:unnamed protein product [Vitrella brassicaformis CCMP3155]|uniref:Cyclin-dependent kinases regulatory subunit n=1 Tax=Vitrella brassicaformis (strain CCMP3155) TaxID=1169540 RepID=A0A0G4FAT0_VITBC|nr:unnamed protein product [Vitrella brassicaformis CCMP3155]|eukprot:CEM10011.1 unnamed protein product [Vitrella brassicaformis CCMP3155]
MASLPISQEREAIPLADTSGNLYGPRLKDNWGELSAATLQEYKRLMRAAKQAGRDTLTEEEWGRGGLRLSMSKGWIHMGHPGKEPNVLLFGRPTPGGNPGY